MDILEKKNLINKLFHLFGINTAPAWPPSPSKSTFKLAGAAMAVTTPIEIPENWNLKFHV